jgi:outer membrane protein assembly factor BamA
MRIVLFLSIILAFLSAANGSSNLKVDSRNQKEWEISISGVKTLDNEEVLNAIGANRDGFWIFKGDYKIQSSLVDSIEENLRGYLDSKGFYDATFKLKKSGGRIEIRVDEKKAVLVSKLKIESDYPIEKLVSFEKGDRFDTEQFVEIKRAIKRSLLRDGYCSYNLSTKAFVDLDRREASLKYTLKKGGRCRFGESEIDKIPKSISPDVILSRMRYRDGEIFTIEKINESYAALNELGCLSSVVIDTDRKLYNRVIPKISTELSSRLNRTSLSLGYDTEVGWRVKGEYNRFNFLGDARKLGVSAEYSSDLRRVQGTLLNPALFRIYDRYFDLRAKGGYKEEDFDSYEEHKGYFDMRLSNISGDFTFDVGVGVENIDIYLKSSDPGIIPGSFALTYPYFRMVYDGRDSKLDPKNGVYLSSYIEYGLPIDDDSTNYYKIIAEARLIRTFNQITFAMVGKAGVIDELGGGVLPASKLFYAGGSYSNRAYGNNDIGITTSKSDSRDLGGHTWLNLSLEMDFPIYDKIGGAIFYDTTMINGGSYDFTGEYIGSIGVGLRYATPMGPLKIDFGANVEEPSINRVSVQIGQSF